MKYVLYELCFVHTKNCCNTFNIILLRYVRSFIGITAVILDVSHVKDGGEDLENIPDVLIRHLKNLHGSSDVSKLLGIISSLTSYLSSLKDNQVLNSIDFNLIIFTPTR